MLYYATICLNINTYACVCTEYIWKDIQDTGTGGDLLRV